MSDFDTPTLPTRIEPVLGDDGKPIDLNPPGPGRWRRDAEGGLLPNDAETADAFGLARPAA